MNKSKIWLSSPHMSGTEQKYVQEAFDTNWVAPLGPNVDEFEKSLVNYTQCGNAAALSSGTAAIHLALILLGVEAGDEVIASSFTFSATVNPIVYQGATPVLIDSERETWNMSPAWLETAIKDRISLGKKPKAIIPVHLYGMPAKIHEILQIAEKYQVPVIEDAAEALGSRYDGKSLGTFGKFGILSFNGNKIITTSGGGALISNDAAMIERSRFLATQARDPAPHYQHSVIGYNYRMSNIVAGVGRGQMEVLDKHMGYRRNNFKFYKENLSGIPGITFLEEPDGGPSAGDDRTLGQVQRYFSNYWLTCILVDPLQTGGLTREDIRMAFESENIDARPLWKPMHLQPVFSHVPFYGDGTSERLFENGLCLPSGSNLTEPDLQRVVDVIRKTL